MELDALTLIKVKNTNWRQFRDVQSMQKSQEAIYQSFSI